MPCWWRGPRKFLGTSPHDPGFRKRWSRGRAAGAARLEPAGLDMLTHGVGERDEVTACTWVAGVPTGRTVDDGSVVAADEDNHGAPPLVGRRIFSPPSSMALVSGGRQKCWSEARNHPDLGWVASVHRWAVFPLGGTLESRRRDGVPGGGWFTQRLLAWVSTAAVL